MAKITIGNVTFDSNIFYAPLAGCSDFPFRQMAKKYSPGLVFCEMVKMDALLRNDQNTYRLLDYTQDMHPIGAQICGSKVEYAADCARIIEGLGFDIIDLNCGCPVDKVTRDGSGSGLLKDPNKIGDIVSNIVAAVSIPVTIKIRVGWDEDHIVAPQIVKIAEQAGASAIFIHGRTRMQAYKGPANWDYIKEAKKVANKIKVFGNGDIFTPADAIEMLNVTGCDGALVARGTFGQPWICQDIQRLQQGLDPLERPFEYCLEQLIEHYHMTRIYAHEKKAILDMRRIGCWYIQKGELAKAFRGLISKVSTIEEIEHLLLSLRKPELLATQLT